MHKKRHFSYEKCRFSSEKRKQKTTFKELQPDVLSSYPFSLVFCFNTKDYCIKLAKSEVDANWAKRPPCPPIPGGKFQHWLSHMM